MNPEKLPLQSADGAQINLDMLYQIAPSCFTEARGADGKVRRVVNFDVLRQLLGDSAADTGEEFYQFTWPGKAEARREAARSIRKTLRPVPEDSVDWDTTQNLYIEGDNLEVLKLLQKSYLGKVKMIYIDPPYNTGNDFVYNDDFAATAADHDRAAGNIDELGNRYRKNTDSNGRFHSDWCSMMFARLQLARNLLAEDGVIFISIDDSEIENLTKLCNEVFGEINFIANLIWKSKSGGANDSKFFAVDHEYLLCYAKSIDNFNLKIDKEATVTTSYNRKDEKGEYSLDRLDKQSIRYSESLDYVIVGPDGTEYRPKHKDPKHPNATWRWGKATVESNYDQLVFENGCVYTKNYKKEGAIARSLLLEDRFGRTRTGKTDCFALFQRDLFSNPKPIKLVRYLQIIASEKDSIILDFFSGSATTAHAVMQLNAEDGGNRKFILVQLPEPTEEDSEARKAGYENICEIGKERIRRAGRKIKEEAGLQGQNLDTGFRVFRVDESNMEDVYFQPAALSQDKLDLFLDNVKPDRTDLDLLFGAMLDWGVQLSLPMSKATIDGCDVYTVNDLSLIHI